VSNVKDEETVSVNFVANQANAVTARRSKVGVVNAHVDRRRSSGDQSGGLGSVLVNVVDEAVGRIGSSEEGELVEEVGGGIRVLESVAGYTQADKGHEAGEHDVD